jgi:hypothetical protein
MVGVGDQLYSSTMFFIPRLLAASKSWPSADGVEPVE